jgi:NAD(P)-dependent dehydrogenase (short-subunit alcohol dehydrogenase family)
MKTVLISGGSRGIGLETAKKFSKHGYIVFLGIRNYEDGLTIGNQLEEQGFKNIIPLLLDITLEQSVKEAFQFIQQHIPRLDALINNAGIRGPQPQFPTLAAIGSIRSIFETNLFGAISLTQTMMPLLRKSSAPRIVNVSSELASLTLHDNQDWKFYSFKDSGYGPSKTALNAYTVMLAYELRDTPFKVNAVDPGYTATAFNGFKGTGQVGAAADLIFRYATLDASGPTGQFQSKEGQLPW